MCDLLRQQVREKIPGAGDDIARIVGLLATQTQVCTARIAQCQCRPMTCANAISRMIVVGRFACVLPVWSASGELSALLAGLVIGRLGAWHAKARYRRRSHRGSATAPAAVTASWASCLEKRCSCASSSLLSSRAPNTSSPTTAVS